MRAVKTAAGKPGSVVAVLGVAVCLLAAVGDLKSVRAQKQDRAAVQGRILDSATRQPIPDTTVQVLPQSSAYRGGVGQTDKNGAFFIDSLARGEYLIRVVTSDYLTYERPCLIRDDDLNSTIEIPLIMLEKKSRRFKADENSNFVELRFNVTDIYGRYVSGLNWNAFTVTAAGMPQDIPYFSDEPAPFTAVILFAVSNAPDIDTLRTTTSASFPIESPVNSVNVTGPSYRQPDYDDLIFARLDVKTGQLIKDDTNERYVTRNYVPTILETKPGITIFETCSMAVEWLAMRKSSRRVLILVTDQLSNKSLGAPGGLPKDLKESGSSMFILGIAEKGTKLSSNNDNHPVVILDELASISGGEAEFVGSPPALDEYFSVLYMNLTHIYTIRFKPFPEKELDPENIRVRVTPPRGLPRLGVSNIAKIFLRKNP